MDERRIDSRHRTYLHGRILYNNGNSSVDCVIRDLSDLGGRVTFSDAIVVPDVFDLHIPNRDETLRAHVEWRRGQEMGIGFAPRESPGLVPAAGADLAERVQRIETELAAMRKIVNELRTDYKLRSGE